MSVTTDSLRRSMSDDMYYDPRSKSIYVIGGEGLISVFQQKVPDHYELTAMLTSRPPSAREQDSTFRLMTRIVFTWQFHLMRGKLRNYGFMR
jgi:hypothetical protein